MKTHFYRRKLQTQTYEWMNGKPAAVCPAYWHGLLITIRLNWSLALYNEQSTKASWPRSGFTEHDVRSICSQVITSQMLTSWLTFLDHITKHFLFIWRFRTLFLSTISTSWDLWNKFFNMFTVLQSYECTETELAGHRTVKQVSY
jgi:hypothetical protein